MTMEEDLRRVDAANLEAAVKQFCDRWAPHNEEYNSQWQTELHMLVRRIYQDAQAPFLKVMTDALMRAQMPPFVIKGVE